MAGPARRSRHARPHHNPNPARPVSVRPGRHRGRRQRFMGGSYCRRSARAGRRCRPLTQRLSAAPLLCYSEKTKIYPAEKPPIPPKLQPPVPVGSHCCTVKATHHPPTACPSRKTRSGAASRSRHSRAGGRCLPPSPWIKGHAATSAATMDQLTEFGQAKGRGQAPGPSRIWRLHSFRCTGDPPWGHHGCATHDRGGIWRGSKSVPRGSIRRRCTKRRHEKTALTFSAILMELGADSRDRVRARAGARAGRAGGGGGAAAGPGRGGGGRGRARGGGAGLGRRCKAILDVINPRSAGNQGVPVDFFYGQDAFPAFWVARLET